MKRWDELRDSLLTTPEARAAYDKAGKALDEAWETECRYGNCTVFVSPDSSVREDLGGWGSVGCPCEGGDDHEAGLGLVTDSRQSTGDSADPCTYCLCVGGHFADCWLLS